MTPKQARLAVAVWLVAAFALAVLVLVVSASARLAVRTLVLLPSFFASLPGSPGDLVSAHPVTEVVELAPIDGFVRAHVYRPPSGRHPALVLSLGIDPAPPDDPRVVRLMSGLARTGLAAILVESDALDHDQLYPDLPMALVEGVQFAEAQPYVRPGRIGLYGFSVGGALALVAAAQPAIRDRLRLVDAFGAYAELEDALLSVATHTLDDDGVIRPWAPDPLAQRHLANALIGPLADSGERELLTGRFVEGDESVPVEPEQLSSEGRAVYALLNTRVRTQGRALLAGLPAVVEQDFAALSPLSAIPQIKARLLLMYDRDDPLLPFTGSRALCRAAQAARLRPYCSGFAIFQHVDPTRGGNAVTVSHDLVELFYHVFAVLRLLQ
jgi:pimeloyl-ACP methyl ester carboxylesterase